MVTIDTDKLIDVLTCSYRLSHKSNTLIYDSKFKIVSFIYSNLFDYCLYLKLSKQVISVVRLNQHLNFLWSSIKDKLQISLLTSERLSIKRKLNYFVDTFSDINNVIYFDVQRYIEINGITISYNYYTFTQNHITKTIIKFNRVVPSLHSSTSFLRVIKSLVKEDLKKTKDKLNHRIYLFRCDTGGLYYPKSISSKELGVAMEYITTTLNKNLFVVKNDFYTCNNCEHNNNCSWKYIND